MSINEIVTRFDILSAQLAPLKKELDGLRKQILAYADGRDYFETSDRAVIITATPSTRLDTVALYRDFPDIKTEYGKETISRSVSTRTKDKASA